MAKAIPAERSSLPPSVSSASSDSLLVFANPDKVGAGAKSGAAPYMPFWPFRFLLCGPPHSGKRNAALNVIVRLDPPPSHIHIIHADTDTKEYEVLQTISPTTMYSPDDPPNFSELSTETDGSPGRPLVIIDEIATKTLPKHSREALQALLGYGSTHKNTSVVCQYQNLTSIDPMMRRCFNLFALWPHVDDAVVNLAAHRVGVPPEEMTELLSLCKKPTDFIVVDISRAPSDPYRFRLNLMMPINRVAS